MSEDYSLQEKAEANRKRRMARIDSMSPELRHLVNEYGSTVVFNLIDCGVTKPNRIRHIVETVLNEFSPSRGTFSKQGLRKNIETGRVESAALSEASR